jgi:hypothetical protein
MESSRIIRETPHLQITLYNFLHISVMSYMVEVYILFNALSFIVLIAYFRLFTESLEVRSHLTHLQL